MSTIAPSILSPFLNLFRSALGTSNRPSFTAPTSTKMPKLPTFVTTPSTSSPGRSSSRLTPSGWPQSFAALAAACACAFALGRAFALAPPASAALALALPLALGGGTGSSSSGSSNVSDMRSASRSTLSTSMPWTSSPTRNCCAIARGSFKMASVTAPMSTKTPCAEIFCTTPSATEPTRNLATEAPSGCRHCVDAGDAARTPAPLLALAFAFDLANGIGLCSCLMAGEADRAPLPFPPVRPLLVPFPPPPPSVPAAGALGRAVPTWAPRWGSTRGRPCPGLAPLAGAALGHAGE
mmetsp:Transcript_59983/g.169970  ORF Transcript_59983/g.169970 Transcript_59983/m.169970 type:complete len:295 (+) Transcript_59983:262-1146(+)